MLRVSSRMELPLLLLCSSVNGKSWLSLLIDDKDKMYYFYRAGPNEGDDSPLTSSAVSKASFDILADTFFFPFKNSSLVLGYFFTLLRNFEGLVQLLVASVADIVLVIFSCGTKPKKLHMNKWRVVKTYFFAFTHSSKSQVLSGVSHLQLSRLHSPFFLLHPDCWQLKVSPALQSFEKSSLFVTIIGHDNIPCIAWSKFLERECSRSQQWSC